MDRIILHADLNYFYAAVECRDNPALRDIPVVVGGDEKKRHGIVLAKNEHARVFGIKTGEALWQARQKCPDLTVVPPDFDKYSVASRLAREIYCRYTDRVESFGPDECWMDLTGCISEFEKGQIVADNIRNEMRDELGLTISVGVSFNKVFAKLASDYKKPDATTVISRENYKTIIWPLPVNALLYVGRATESKLSRFGIKTIGQLAKSDRLMLKRMLGKNGEVLWLYANGMDTSPVKTEREQVKSVGNSTTLPRDITSREDVRVVLYALCEKVAARLREQNLVCCGVQLSVRDINFTDTEHQAPLRSATDTSQEMFDAIWKLYSSCCGPVPVRALGVRAIRIEKGGQEQLSLFSEDEKIIKHKRIEEAKDSLGKKYGTGTVRRGVLMTKSELIRIRGYKLDVKE